MYRLLVLTRAVCWLYTVGIGYTRVPFFEGGGLVLVGEKIGDPPTPRNTTFWRKRGPTHPLKFGTQNYRFFCFLQKNNAINIIKNIKILKLILLYIITPVYRTTTTTTQNESPSTPRHMYTGTSGTSTAARANKINWHRWYRSRIHHHHQSIDQSIDQAM